jgi:hypothetical protein
MAKMDPDDRQYCGGVLTVREWRELQAAFEHRCAYCGATHSKLIPEHVEALSRGGEDERENIVPACRSCNCSKADLMLLEWVFAQHGPCERVAFCNRYADGYTYFDKRAGLLPTIRFIKPRSMEKMA